MVCSRCGKCCDYEIGGIIKTCKYLQFKIDNTTFCPIYGNRIGTIIDKEILDYNYNNTGDKLVRKIICGYRKNNPIYIQGCTELI